MAPPEGFLPISVASVVEDVLQQQGTRPREIDVASRKAEEAAGRRHEAASWLRKTVGVVGAKDLSDKPTEEEMRLALRSGLLLCNALNKVHPGSIPKVVENPDSALLPDGAALSAYQYFENVRNFLVAVEDKGLPTFEASDLEQGGKSGRVVDCILALKSYSDWRQTGGSGSWKYGGILKPISSAKYFTRKHLEPFANPFSKSICSNEKVEVEQDFVGDINGSSIEMPTSQSLNLLVRAVLSGRKPEEVPTVVESLLRKIVMEFELRMASQIEVKTTLKDSDSDSTRTFSRRKVLAELAVASDEPKTDENCTHPRKETCFVGTSILEDDLKHKVTKGQLIVEQQQRDKIAKQQSVFEKQQRDIEELKHYLCNTKLGIKSMQVKYIEDLNILSSQVKSLAYAASGYHKVLEENRKLYNELQDLKGNIRVYCRVRPFLPGQQNTTCTIGHLDDGNITIVTPSKHGKEGRRLFTFNKVFAPFATQDEVYCDTQPLIRSVVDGYNVCIFAYGQTGSGKTFTMTGPRNITEQSQGVNYRALSDLFYLSEQRKDTFCYEISVQMIEIYNEQVRDLLASDGANKKLEIRNSSQKGMNVPDASLVPVTSTLEVIELMDIGQRNRVVGATALNDRSSRSHSCLTVHVKGRELASGTVLRGCMHLVDLAGSERVEKSEVTGERMKEAQHINRSLSALGDVIAALAQKNSHVPYRNSKLTQLLQDSLGGQAKTLMFVHISPEPDAVGETISTLKFAERVSTVELGAARLNKESREVKELRDQIASLKAELARKAEPEQVDSKSTAGVQKIKGGSVTRQKRPSFELQDISAASSPPWPDSSGDSVQRGEENEIDIGDWIDKVMVNKLEDTLPRGDPSGCWEEDNSTRLPELYYQSCLPGMKIYSDPLYSRNGISRQGSIATTDDSEELEIATSDSSEADLLWQFNLSTKSTSVVTGSVSRIKRPQLRPPQSPDIIRTPIQTHGPLPSRKPLNGSSQSLSRTGSRQQMSSVADRRHLSNGKARNAK